MSITLTYEPGKGVSFGNILLLWDTERQKVRTLLKGQFEIGDSVLDVSEYFDGDSSQNIIMRRDIYKHFQGQDNYFFLDYDKNDRLTDVELHYGLNINIKGVSLDFSMDIGQVAQLLDSISDDKEQLVEGEYFYKNLKLTIASSKAMGGEGGELGYFYCSKDVTHLIEG